MWGTLLCTAGLQMGTGPEKGAPPPRATWRLPADVLLKIKVFGEGLLTVGAFEFLGLWLPCS